MHINRSGLCVTKAKIDPGLTRLLTRPHVVGGSLLQGFQAIPAWQRFFNFPKGAKLGLLSASYFLPSVPSAFLGDWVSTKYGRRACIATGMLFVLIGTFVNAFAVNVGMWIGGKRTYNVSSRCYDAEGVRLNRPGHYRCRHRYGKSCCPSVDSGERASSTPTHPRLVLPE